MAKTLKKKIRKKRDGIKNQLIVLDISFYVISILLSL